MLQHPLFPRRHAIFLLVFSLVCTQFPLLNYLGYEFSAATALVFSWVVGFVFISGWREHPPRSSTEFFKFLRLKALVVVGLWSIPLIVLSANALFVRNCSMSEGLLFYILLPIPSALFAAGLASVVVVFLKKWHKTVFSLTLVVILLQIVEVSYFGPQIFAFNPVLGFFPGVTYDESLDVLSRLALYRLTTVAAAFLLFHAAYERVLRSADIRPPFNSARLLGPVILAVIVVGGFLFNDELRFSSSERSIRETLGGRMQTEHFDIIYANDALSPARLEQLALLHEYYYEELTARFGLGRKERVQSFLYASAQQKGMLIGAARTNIAKPWLRQVHLNIGDAESVLKHELVHVIAGEFGLPVIRAARNSGLIEGLAIAMEPTQFNEPLDRAAAIALASGIDADVRSLFTLTGFLRARPAVAYTLAGSFCRYLIDAYGIRRFQEVYRSNDFMDVYGIPLDELISDWRLEVTAIELSATDRKKGEVLFLRPTIFAKECARVTARRNEAARNMLAQRDAEGALALAEQTLLLTRNPEALTIKIQALFRLGKYADAIAIAEETLQDTSFARGLLQLQFTLADAYVMSGEVGKGEEWYRNLLNLHLSLSWDEASALRLAMIGRPDARDLFLPLIAGGMDDSARFAYVQGLAERKSPDPLSLYLWGRELAARDSSAAAIVALTDAHPVGPLQLPELDFVRRRRIARLLSEQRMHEKAKMVLWESLNVVPNEAQALETREWIGRSSWLSERERERRMSE